MVTSIDHEKPHTETSKFLPQTTLPPDTQHSRTQTIPKGLLCFLLFFIIFFTSMIIMAAYYITLHFLGEVYSASEPVFHVQSVNMHPLNSSVSDSTLNWNATIMVENPKSKLGYHFHPIEVYVFDADKCLSILLVKPFYVGKKSHTFEVNIVIDSDITSMGKRERVQNLSHEEQRFSLRMYVRATYGPGSRWQQYVRREVFCEDIKAGFESAKCYSLAFF